MQTAQRNSRDGNFDRQTGGLVCEWKRAAMMNRPVLIIGLGGTGIRAMLAAKHEIQREIKAPADAPLEWCALRYQRRGFPVLDSGLGGPAAARPSMLPLYREAYEACAAADQHRGRYLRMSAEENWASELPELG